MQELKKLGVNDINAYTRITMHISSLIPRGRTPLFIESFELVTKILATTIRTPVRRGSLRIRHPSS